MSEASDGDDFDPDTVFDFPELVYTVYVNWRLACSSMLQIRDLLSAVGALSEALPMYMDDSKADDELVLRIAQLDQTMRETLMNLKVAKHANEEISEAFRLLDHGMKAQHEMTRLAYRTGFGTA